MMNDVKILIVDDEPDICYFLSNSLSKRGFITSSSNNLTDAEKKIKADLPGILLLDNHLPDGKGVDFVRKICAEYPELRIIMITAHDSPQDRAKAYTNGSSFFLAKPFTISAVNQVIDLVLSTGS